MRADRVQLIKSFIDISLRHEVRRDSAPDLLQSLAGQVRLCHREPVALRCKVSHLTVGGPVMQSNSGQIVESFIQVVSHIGCKTVKKQKLIILLSANL